jgi:hypothetical protein
VESYLTEKCIEQKMKEEQEKRAAEDARLKAEQEKVSFGPPLPQINIIKD